MQKRPPASNMDAEANRPNGWQCSFPKAIIMTTSTFDFGAPVNTVLALAIFYYAQKLVFPSVSLPSKPPTEFKDGYSWMPKSHPPTVLFKTYTPTTLAPFDGKDGGRILLAIKGKVFDVTAGRNFYGPGVLYPNDRYDFLNQRCLLIIRWNVRELCRKRCFKGYG